MPAVVRLVRKVICKEGERAHFRLFRLPCFPCFCEQLSRCLHGRLKRLCDGRPRNSLPVSFLEALAADGTLRSSHAVRMKWMCANRLTTVRPRETVAAFNCRSLWPSSNHKLPRLYRLQISPSVSRCAVVSGMTFLVCCRIHLPMAESAMGGCLRTGPALGTWHDSSLAGSRQEGCSGILSDLRERLVQVSNYVLYVFDSHGDAHQSVRNPDLPPDVWRN